MYIKQIFKPADNDESCFVIEGADLTAPTPDTGDTIHWIANARTFTAQVQSKTFSYDKDEVSLGRNDDWGLTITIIVDIIDAA